MDAWMLARAYPDGKCYVTGLTRGFEQKQQLQMQRSGPDAHWRALGPKNFGGRTLCLAFHPVNPDIIYAGSASGGLWKTTTGGMGYNAWQQVPTGFPVLGVGAIAIQSDNPDVMYIGTGEVYRYQNSGTGFTLRINRGSYGIGILKTTDGGLTWSKSLDWSVGELRGIERIVINPLNANTVYAATSEGLYRSYDAGASWVNIHPVLMAVDIEINPLDTNKVYVTHGCYDNAETGVYRSLNGGQSFQKLTNGIPDHYTGKTLLCMGPDDPNLLYASVANFDGQVGLYKTTNGGDGWVQVNSQDIAQYQGWYAHDVALDPAHPGYLMMGGIDVFKSKDAGLTFEQKTYWYNWYFDATPVGGPEGSADYVHADIHALYYHPLQPDVVFAVCDGGIFASTDGGETFEGRNGSYQTVQFYANFSNSASDSTFAIGGLQDNATAIYHGDDAWSRVIGGDGMSTAIHPDDDNIVYGSLYYMRIYRSDDHGQSFNYLFDATPSNFNSPFELAPSNPSVIYGGADRIFRSTDGGNSFIAPNNNPVDNSNPILTIAVAPDNSSLLYISTSPNSAPPPKVKKSINGGNSFTDVAGLPDRLCMDITFKPDNHNTVYAVFGGFNTHHVYKTTDGGQSWSPSDEGLPDVPTNTLLVDPLYPDELYLGNDLGVYFSPDGGESWELYSDGLPDAVLAMHLSISPSNRKLRVATHGNGVYEGDLVSGMSVSSAQTAFALDGLSISAYPNPFSDQTTVSFSLQHPAKVDFKIYDGGGKLMESFFHSTLVSGNRTFVVDTKSWPSGVYFYTLEAAYQGKVLRKTRKLIKE